MPSARPALYASAIQHVLVLQEDDAANGQRQPSSEQPSASWPTSPQPNACETATAAGSAPAAESADAAPERRALNSWRVRDRMTTANGVLVLCLNIGVDPPDVPKPSPCARLECWKEPNAESPSKSLIQIAAALKEQYERWQLMARYKVAPDPTAAELKRICVNLRRTAKDERVLFHYNGHGVPKPTPNGEIWVFNNNFTQYIPMNLYDLQEVLGSPSLYVFDCSGAGIVLRHFQKMNDQLDRDWAMAVEKGEKPPSSPRHRNSIVLVACRADEILPTSPTLPADLFTSCLTTPIKAGLRWFVERTLVQGVTAELIDRLPGNHSNRQTPLGELNWIFTAVTDAIAWNVLPRDLFKLLYRQDLLLASLMRNFLLADRIMRSYGCTPISQPALPQTHNHPLWDSFDLAVEQVLSQLQTLVKAMPSVPADTASAVSPPPFVASESAYVPSTFFEDQMKAFDVWLDMGPSQRHPPDQLPIMLQTLLSPVFRVKALPILCRYLQTGPMAVDFALSMGIFPYVSRLLQSPAKGMRRELVFIWSKILALDHSCASDLVKEKGEEYFVRFLEPSTESSGDNPEPVFLVVALFVLSVVAKEYADRCRDVGTIQACNSRLTHPSPFVRRWACLCLTTVIRNASQPTPSDVLAWHELVETLKELATCDVASDVRAAATSALSAIMGGVLRSLTRHDGSENVLQCSRGDYQPNKVQLSAISLHRTETRPTSGSASAQSPLGNGSSGANSTVQESDQSGESDAFYVGEADYLDAPVPEYSADERDALLKIGHTIAEIGRREASVLTRREAAIAIAKAVRYQRDRFVRAAHITDVIGIDDSREPAPYTDVDKCELVYRKLWTTLSELAYDPHPVVAALARRMYDAVSDTLWTKSAPVNTRPREPLMEEISATDHVFSPKGQSPDSSIMGGNSPPFPSNMKQAEQKLMREEGCKQNAEELWRNNPHSSGVETSASQSSLGGNGRLSAKDGKQSGLRMPPLTGGVHSGARPSHVSHLRDGTQRVKRRMPNQLALDIKAPTSTIHVRSTSGSFDLNVSSRLPFMSNIPRVSSASLIQLRKEETTPEEPAPVEPPPPGPVPDGASETTQSVRAATDDQTETERPRSLPHIALARGVGMLVKTVSQQLNRSATGSPSQCQPRSPESSGSSGEQNEVTSEAHVKSQSPPRPPKRSLSYQVLNAVSSLAPDGELPLFSTSRSTYFASPSMSPSEESLHRVARELPRGYDRLYLSGAGDAALSLYEWSSAYIARVEFDATTTDYVHREEAIPRYAAFWDKFIKSRGNIPSESLRAFALLGDSGSGMGVGSCGADEDHAESFASAIELSSYAMGAGGGAVTAMAFLPRDIGCGDDQLIATGDNTGSVGVYDIRTGTCQGSFGIPFPPGIPEVGVSSILCLNRPSSHMPNVTNGSLANSRSALILAGAYDGRVAVFKSDLHGPKYRIMSTFQASGQSLWSKAGTTREPSLHHAARRNEGGSSRSSVIERPQDLQPLTFAESVRESGNGLVLAFDADSSLLAAAGCDSEVVRIWDLSREQCVWEGKGVARGTVPTAVSLWGSINPSVFVVGSSEGKVNMIDMRVRAPFEDGPGGHVMLGSLEAPVISLGTCPPVGGYPRELAVSADIGGEIAFWDPRWNLNRSSYRTPLPTLSRIQAHRSNLTAMSVHPEGKLIASGSTAKCVKVFGPKRNMLKMICNHETGHGKSEFSKAGSRIPPVTSLSFQPESYLLAIGCVDSSVIIYGHPDIFPGVDANIGESVWADGGGMYEYWK